MAEAIQTSDLKKNFGTTRALSGVDMTVRTGTVLGLLGPNGAGKTTALRILATLMRPDGGSARVGGFDVVRQPDRVRELIALTGQYSALDEDLTGRENLILVARLLELPRREARIRAARLMERFDLVGAAGRPVRTYSGGMRRRLDLAASLVGRPAVLFLDEPTTGLDPRSRNEVWRMVRGLVADGMTVLLTTQYLDEADRLADEIAVIDRGRLVASGTAAALKAKVAGQTLDIRPADPADLPEVAALVATLVGAMATTAASPHAGGSASGADDPGLLSVPVPDADVLPEVVAALRDRRIAVAELALRLASLDEVFLALTGHQAEEATR